MPNTKRAYSEEAKQQREQKIIAAAEALLMEKGYYAINMDQVARSAGLAKGTVYLYFKTKEELFLTVFERQSAAWFTEMEQALSVVKAGTPVDTLADLLVKAIIGKSLLTRLVALSPILFEYNISLERARSHKLWIYDELGKIGHQIDTMFNLHPQHGLQVLLQMVIIVAGLEGLAHPSPIVKQVYETEPTLPQVDFETELRHLLLILLNAAGE